MCSAFKISSAVSTQARTAPPRVTANYVELELPLDETTALLLYYLPQPHQALWVATCWEERFEQFFHRPNTEAVLQQRLRTWPTLGLLLWNGLRHDYARGALIQAVDCDTQTPKWMLVCEVSQVNAEDAFSLFGAATRRATELVKTRSLQLREELRNDFFVLREE